MCDTTPDAEWTPYYFGDVRRFPWIDSSEPMYARFEACPNCTETQVRLVDPRSFRVVDDDGGGAIDREPGEPTDDPGWASDDGVDGVDLDRPT